MERARKGDWYRQGSSRAWTDWLFGVRLEITRSWGHKNVPLKASVSPLTEETRPCADGGPDVEGLEFEASVKGLETSLTPPFLALKSGSPLPAAVRMKRRCVRD